MQHASLTRRPRAHVAAIAFATLAIMAVAFGGCASSSKTSAGAAPAPARQWADSPNAAALVMMPAAEADLESAGGWETARSDANLGSVNGPFITVFGAAQVRQYERLSTVNGRPRDNSWTTSRATQVIVQP